MVSILVKENGIAVSKEVYAGDTSQLQADLDQRTIQDDALSFEIFDDSRMDEFNAIEIVSAPSHEQTQWSALNTVDEKIAFIAKKMGLE